MTCLDNVIIPSSNQSPLLLHPLAEKFTLLFEPTALTNSCIQVNKTEKKELLKNKIKQKNKDKETEWKKSTKSDDHPGE